MLVDNHDNGSGHGRRVEEGGVATFFQAPSQQCLTRPVIALHQGQGCEAGWNTLLPIHRNTANSALRRDEIKVADSPTL